MTYTLSFYTRVNVSTLKRRPWWNLFGRDELVAQEQLQRFVFHGLTKQQADAVIEATKGTPTLGTVGHLLLRLASRDGTLDRLQLVQEQAAQPTYVRTRGNTTFLGGRG